MLPVALELQERQAWWVHREQPEQRVSQVHRVHKVSRVHREPPVPRDCRVAPDSPEHLD